MNGRNANPVPGRPKADTWAIPFPKKAVLIGDADFIRGAEAYFSSSVREVHLLTIPTEEGDEPMMPPGFPLQGPWCLVCDLVTSSRSLRVARKILLQTSNVPFIALASDPEEIPEADLRSILELGITHVLPVPGSWQEAWGEIRKILARRLNPLLSVHSTKMWLVGVLQSVGTQEKNCCVRISSRSHGKSRSTSRDHGTSLRISPVGLLGEIYFHEGQPVYAWSTRLQGDDHRPDADLQRPDLRPGFGLEAAHLERPLAAPGRSAGVHAPEGPGPAGAAVVRAGRGRTHRARNLRSIVETGSRRGFRDAPAADEQALARDRRRRGRGAGRSARAAPEIAGRCAEDRGRRRPGD
jgi:hypothetical protein